MITFFTTAKAFTGHSGIIQRNALKSWTLLHPDIEVIVFGDEEGVEQTCAELGLRQEKRVERHESGMKFLDYMFEVAQKIGRHDYLCYSNCDIVLTDDFWRAFRRAVAWRKWLLMVGRRWDTDITEPLNFATSDWGKSIRRRALETGYHQDFNFADFFVFPRGLYDHVPNLVVGRSYWDHWLVWKALSANAAVLDCSDYAVAVHQNHGYAYHPQGKQGTNEDALARRNADLCGHGSQLRSIIDSSHKLTSTGKIRRTPFRRYIAEHPAKLRFEKIWQSVLINTFAVRKRLGLRRQTVRNLLRHEN
jgi:hypothetical protein